MERIRLINLTMKTIVLSLALAALAAASPLLEKRGVEQGPFFFSPISKPAKLIETESSLKPGAKHVTVRYGPFQIPGNVCD
jgi:hypothetical protein